MKKLMTLVLAFFSVAVFAHCPQELTVDGKDYCFSYEWVEGPFLNGGHGRGHHAHHGMKKMKPKSSSLFVQFWQVGDSTHTPVEFDGIRIYPWMIMANGMEHGTRQEVLSYDDVNGGYHVEGIYLSKMMGYWEMRIAFPLDFEVFDPKTDYETQFATVE